jgi:DNA (cytosine-5)-methyltransferase 1
VALPTISLCSGYGGLELGLEAAGLAVRTVCFVEREAYAAANLVALMEQGRLAEAPVWSDLTTFDAKPWAGKVACLNAGFPCQPFSVAGKRQHTEDERWLWDDIDRILRELRSLRLVFLENVPGLAVRGLGHVLGTMAELGLDAEVGVFRASDAGAPHRRARMFILAFDPELRGSNGRSVLADAGCWSPSGNQRGGLGRRDAPQSQSRQGDCGEANASRSGPDVADSDSGRLEVERQAHNRDGSDARRHVSDRRDENVADPSSTGLQGDQQQRARGDGDGQSSHGPTAQLRSLWPPGPDDSDGWRRWVEASGPKPGLRRGSDGTGSRVDQLRLLGNGVVPQQAALAFRVLAERGGLI